MDDERRPDPDAILSEIKRSENPRGKLKIFLGYAPGVGKTYTMLLEAHALKKRGLDVVIGYVETHKRAETNALIEGIEIIPRQKLPYRNLTLEEMDVEAIISRKPAFVLVDELAHTNAQGSRHPKRYQDVKEILEHGIDVLTTVNIQHFESQNDLVAQITGIQVQETLPDSILEEADEIKLIDIPLEELFLRLREGKIYLQDQAQRAVQNFFRRGNLTALREITLRKVALKIDSELINYKKARLISEPWPVAERIMACISPSPFSKQLVRRAYNMASYMGSEWFVLYVATPKFRTLTPKDQSNLSETINLAENLGGKVFTISGSDIADEIINFAKDKNVTRVLIGKPLRSPYKEFLKRSPTYKLTYDQSPFDVQLITPINETKPSSVSGNAKAARIKFEFRNYLTSVLFLIPLTFLIVILRKFIYVPSLEILYLIAAIASAILYGIGPAITTSVISVLVYDFFFVDPIYRFTVSRPEHFVSLVVFLIVSVIVSQLINRSKNQYSALKLRLSSLSLIEDLSKELLKIPLHEEILKDFESTGPQPNNILKMIKTTVLEEISQIAVKYVGKIVQTGSVALLKNERGILRLLAKSSPGLELNEKELGIADLAFRKNILAGFGTDNLTEIKWAFMPVSLSDENTIGVIGISCNYKNLFLEQKNLINTVLKLSSMAMANWM
jgi:two-component system, OmpR family, sensor histidine kinase KdpD